MKTASTTKVIAGAAAAAVAGGKLVSKVVGESGKALGVDPHHPGELRHTLTVAAPADAAYRFWRDPGSYTHLSAQLAEVTTTSPDSMHWIMSAPLGRTLSWTLRIDEDRPGERVRWVTAPASAVDAGITVGLRPPRTGGGTAMTLEVAIDPGRSTGAALWKVSGATLGTLVVKAIYRAKALIDTGEMPTLRNNPSARPGDADRI